MEYTKCIVEVHLFDWDKSPADGRFVGATLVESDEPQYPDEERDIQGKPQRDAEGHFVYDETEMKAYQQASDEANKKAIVEAKRHSLSTDPWRVAHLWDDTRITSYTKTLVGSSKVWQPYMNRLLTIEECIKIGRHTFDHSGKRVAQLWCLNLKAPPKHRFVGKVLVETTDHLSVSERFEGEVIAEAKRHSAYPDLDGLWCAVTALECAPTIWEPYMNRLLDEAESAAIGLRCC